MGVSTSEEVRVISSVFECIMKKQNAPVIFPLNFLYRGGNERLEMTGTKRLSMGSNACEEVGVIRSVLEYIVGRKNAPVSNERRENEREEKMKERDE